MKKLIKECLKNTKFKVSVHAVVKIAKETSNPQLKYHKYIIKYNSFIS